jgi:hypothetical protein
VVVMASSSHQNHRGVELETRSSNGPRSSMSGFSEMTGMIFFHFDATSLSPERRRKSRHTIMAMHMASRAMYEATRTVLMMTMGL